MELNIIYEDKDILVCLKPAGVATQTAKLSGQDMVSMVKNYLAKQKGVKMPYVGVIHRLDQPVSGLLVFAKNQKAASSLSKQIQDGNANKDYIALCEGILEEKRGTLVHYLKKDSVTKMAKVISREEYEELSKKKEASADGVKKGENLSEYKKSILTYEVEEGRMDATIVNVHLQTGRFHQIRAQFSYLGHALLGDAKYGSATSRQLSMQQGIRQIALCANCLDFIHPVTGEKMHFKLEEKYLPKWYENRRMLDKV